jgi:hypothetical protein
MVRLLLALSLFAVEARADDKSAKDGAAETSLDDKPVTVNPGGEYHGVAPGAQNLPPRPPKMPVRKGPQRLTWSGFQIKDGVPTVFVELTGSPNYSVEAQKDSLVVTLRNTVVPIRNNRRPLRVEEFGTPVKTVETESHGATTRVVIHGDGPLGHSERIEPAHGGFQLLVIQVSKK